MAKDVTEEIFNLVGKKELAAYSCYIRLTSYENLYKSDENVIAANHDYATRDMNFPVDLSMKAE
jgi:hypothetical protein